MSPLFLKIKFYRDRTTFIYLLLCVAAFATTTPELHNHNINDMVPKFKDIYYLTLYRKNLPICDLA